MDRAGSMHGSAPQRDTHWEVLEKSGLRTWIVADLLQPLHLACILIQSAPKE